MQHILYAISILLKFLVPYALSCIKQSSVCRLCSIIICVLMLYKEKAHNAASHVIMRS